MKTKAEWAAGKAAELHRQADQWPTVRAADWQGVRATQTLRDEARRFERMAERFKAQGL